MIRHRFDKVARETGEDPWLSRRMTPEPGWAAPDGRGAGPVVLVAATAAVVVAGLVAVAGAVCWSFGRVGPWY
jgi:hypothetical protein